MVTGEIIFNDPWPGRFADKNGFNKRMVGIENLMPWAVVYPPKEKPKNKYGLRGEALNA